MDIREILEGREDERSEERRVELRRKGDLLFGDRLLNKCLGS